MRRRPPVFRALATIAALLLTVLITAIPAAAKPDRAYTIGVDGAGPAGHNFEYVDYFPRGQVLPSDPQTVVGNSAVIDFKYNFTSLDGLHTATLLPAGETPAQAWAAQPLIVPDEPESAPPPNVVFNPAAIFPNPGGCGGSSSNPCTYDGTGLVSSGAMPAFAGSDFFVKIALATSKPTTVHYVCLIHPGMQGNFKVVPGQGSSPAAFADAAATQLAADTAGALAAESAVDSTSVSQNPDGTRTVTMTAGTATQFVDVEMLPRNVTINKGDTVNWVTLSQKDPHTVTFPDLGENFHPLDPLQPVCEGAAGDAPPAGGPPDFGCAPNPVELTVSLFPQGGTQILSPGTFATSGIIATFPPLPNQFSFSFPNPGTFAYQCRIHDHMNGVITVTS